MMYVLRIILMVVIAYVFGWGYTAEVWWQQLLIVYAGFTLIDWYAKLVKEGIF